MNKYDEPQIQPGATINAHPTQTSRRVGEAVAALTVVIADKVGLYQCSALVIFRQGYATVAS